MLHLIRPTLLFPLALAVLAGCASLSPEQCKQADWRQIGYADGTRGLSGAHIEEHGRACASLGIRPDLDAYLQGRNQGLLSYCQPENGFQVGRRGTSHIAGDCPEPMRAPFIDQYALGIQIHAIESELSRRRNEQSDLRSRIRQHDNRITDIKNELGKKETSAERRNTLVNELQSRAAQKEGASRDLFTNEDQIDRLQRRLQQRLREIGR